jgi:hypothetical protein
LAYGDPLDQGFNDGVLLLVLEVLPLALQVPGFLDHLIA